MSYVGQVSGEPTQETPEGASIPVPKRGDVLRDLRKVAKPVERPSDTDAEGAGEK